MVVKASRGRPTKYNATVHEQIVKALEAGAFKKHAAEAAGVAIQTFDLWLQQGRDGREPYVRLLRDCEAAIARDAIRNQAAISRAATTAAPGDWKAAAWNLMKKHPRLYGGLPDPPEAPARVEPPVYSPWKDGAH